MDEREEESGVNLADPDSPLGLLQRGRGKGYLLALEMPPQAVWPLLFECITNDPRLDTQCEDRAEYYAGLIAAQGMDVGPLGQYLRQSDGQHNTCDCCVGLILDTLGCLAHENAAARQILIEYVSYGRKWALALRMLAHLDDHEALERAVEALCPRVRTDSNVQAQFAEAVHESWKWYCWHDEDARRGIGFFLPICAPWNTICKKHGDLADCFAKVGIAYDRPSPARERPSEAFLASLSLEGLFERVTESNCTSFWRVLPQKVSADHESYLLERLAAGDNCHMSLALRGLGELGTLRAFEAVKSFIEGSEDADRRVRHRAFDAIERMPGSLTLETARQWFRRKEWRFQVAAGGVLEEHAEPKDIALLLEVLRTPESIRREDFRLPSALNAMARFEDIGPVPELEHVFFQTQYCFDRYRAANAMAATAPVHFTADYAFECLWDCHWDLRRLGCEMVSLSRDGVLERLRELAADPSESDDVREEAQARLDEF